MTRGRAAEAAAATALLLVVALQVHTLDDSDTWWHLASGRLIAAERAVARADPFSFTAPGAPWINRQWLFDLAAYGTWRAGGPAGPILLAAALFTAAFATLYALARRRLPAWGAAALVVLAAQAAVERFTVRPEAATFLLLATYLLVLDRASLGLRALVALVVLQAVWANLHALSVLGLVVLGAELVSAAAARWLPLPPGWRHASRRDGRAVAGLAAATAGAIAAEAATPFGLAGALFPLRLLGVLRGAEVTSAPIIEHRAPALAELSPPVALGLVALLALAALAALVSWRRWRIAHLLIAAAFTALALVARRNVALIGPGVLPLVASGLAPVAAAADRRLARRPRAGAALGATLALGFALATVLVVSGDYYRASRLTRTFGLGVSGLLFPAGAVDFLDAAAPSARLFNDDVLGGYLLWRDYPRRRVFIDGRFQVYPGAVYAEYQKVLEEPRAFAPLAARYGLDAAILYHPGAGRLELARAIASIPGWRIAYLDGGAIVLLADHRASELPAGVIGPPLARPAARTEEALAYYQRGRALLFLFGRQTSPLARADFEAALRVLPGLHEARVGLGMTSH